MNLHLIKHKSNISAGLGGAAESGSTSGYKLKAKANDVRV